MPIEGDVLNNRYQILRVLSDEGGMGVIYLATDFSFNDTVVIKHSRFTEQFIKQQYPALPPDQMHQFAERLWKAFAREARLLRGLNHPALPHVIDYFTVGDEQQFFVMDFIAGQDFNELLKERKQRQEAPFAWAEVRDWADQLLDALDYLHTHFAEPIIHRDIKPGNLKRKPDGKIVLLDFGLAKGTAGEMSVVGSVLSGAGTPQYAPLEQMHREGTDARSDLYSLAVTLHHLLTGEEPPKADFRSFEINCQRPDPLHPAHELNPQIPAAVSEALQHAAALDPDARPATAAEMRESLRRAGQTEFVPNPGQPSGQPSEPTTIDPPPTPKPTPTLQSLIDAINEENVGIVRDLLDQGVAINALDEHGSSPLVAAVNKCSYAIVKMLLARGADLETRTSSGATALIAIVNRDVCINGNRIAQALLDAGADVNAKDNSGRTVLIHAVTWGLFKMCDPKFVEALLAKGADVNGKDGEGRTALMVEIQKPSLYSSPRIIQALLDKGADVNAKDNKGWTALMLAEEVPNNEKVIEMLEKAGAK